MSRAQHPGPVTTHKTHWTSHSQLVHIIVHFPTLVCVEGDSAALMERQQGDQNFNNILLVFFFYFIAPPGWIYTGYSETSEGSPLSPPYLPTELLPEMHECARP